MPENECFIIPVKIDTPSQEFYIRRCLKSIRRLYPTTRVIIALSKGTSPLVVDDPNIIQVDNPYFSTLGCIYLFYKHKYADYAFILHDSMVVNKPLPRTDRDVSFIYYFYEPGMAAINYTGNYQKILTPYQHADMMRNQKNGCFGVSMGLKHSIIQNLNILHIIPTVTTKDDFCAMERIFAYLCDSNGVNYDALCGSIFGPADPWVHPEFSTMTLEEILDRKYPMCVIKSMVGRKE